jgi:myo-inositol-1-phosphate synthase
VDSPNSAGVVIDAVRYLKVAAECGVRGALRGPSAFTQKTPPQFMSLEASRRECDALCRREVPALEVPQTVLEVQKPAAHMSNAR